MCEICSKRREPTLIVVGGDDLKIKMEREHERFMMNEEGEFKLIKGNEIGYKICDSGSRARGIELGFFVL